MYLAKILKSYLFMFSTPTNNALKMWYELDLQIEKKNNVDYANNQYGVMLSKWCGFLFSSGIF